MTSRRNELGAGRDVADCCDAGLMTLSNAAIQIVEWDERLPRPRSAITSRIQSTSDIPGCAQRLLQIAEFEMRVGVDQPGQRARRSRDRSPRRRRLCADRNDPLAIDRHDAVFDRRPIDRKYNASFQRKRHDAIVAEFARIRPARSKRELLQVQLRDVRAPGLLRAAQTLAGKRVMRLAGRARRSVLRASPGTAIDAATRVARRLRRR